MANQSPKGESDDADARTPRRSRSDSGSQGRVNANLRITRGGFDVRFKASLTTDDNELSHRFWGTVIRHLRCWLAVAASAVLVLALAAGLFSGRLIELINTLLG